MLPQVTMAFYVHSFLKYTELEKYQFGDVFMTKYSFVSCNFTLLGVYLYIKYMYLYIELKGTCVLINSDLWFNYDKCLILR